MGTTPSAMPCRTSCSTMAGSPAIRLSIAFMALAHIFTPSAGPKSVMCGPRRCAGSGATGARPAPLRKDSGSPLRRGPNGTWSLPARRCPSGPGRGPSGVEEATIAASVHSRSLVRAASTLSSCPRTALKHSATYRNASRDSKRAAATCAVLRSSDNTSCFCARVTTRVLHSPSPVLT
jgi:hypothetical protein